MTSREVECGKTEIEPSHQTTAPHARRSTRNTATLVVFRVIDGGVCAPVAVFSPARPSLWVRTLQRRTATQRVVQTVVSEEIQPAHNGLMVILSQLVYPRTHSTT